MPEWRQEIRQRLAGMNLTPVPEGEIVKELSQDLEDHYADSMAGGATPAEAYLSALAQLSEGEMLQCELRRVEQMVAPEPIAFGTNRRSDMTQAFWQDLRYAVRTLMQQPGFTAVVVLTMALCIGVNAAFFILFSLAFRPLPVEGSGPIVKLLSGSLPDYVYLRDNTQVFSGVIATSRSVLDVASTPALM